ncbi:hypothetical protein AB1Y20_015809 [Prymnesium parvum]|uniref:200 kDa antigen p200 n=1 Tax=Prymnesium parvum TaxID=97485 RepID=A0AB34K1K4_PRYPA
MEELHAAEEEARLIERALREGNFLAVEDRLLTAGRAHHARRLALHEAGLKAKSDGSTFAPQPNPRSDAILRASGRRSARASHADIASRLWEEAYKSKQRALELHEQKEAALAQLEMAGATFAPEINARSRELAEHSQFKGGVVERNSQWAEAREAELREAQRREQQRQAEELRPPQLSRGSLQLVARMGRSGRVEEEIAARHEHACRELASRREHWIHEETRAQPEITGRAAALCRAGEVGPRLHEYASVYAERRRLLREIIVAEERGLNPHDATRKAAAAGSAASGGGSAVSDATSRASRHGAPSSLEGDLAHRHERRAARLRAEEARFPFKPQLDPHSLTLAGKRRSASFGCRRKGGAAAEAREATDADTLAPGASRNCTFVPRLNDTSLRMQQAAPTGRARLAQLHALHAAAEAKRKQAQASKKDDEMDECTFAPALGGGRRDGAPAAHAVAGDIAERCDAWATRREAALRREREALAAQELDGCTFQPALCAEPYDEMSDVLDTAWRPFALGVDEFVSRRRRVIAEREQAAAPAPCNWTGRPTVPVEFQFNRHERGGIRALQRPVEFTPALSSRVSSDSLCSGAFPVPLQGESQSIADSRASTVPSTPLT